MKNKKLESIGKILSLGTLFLSLFFGIFMIAGIPGVYFLTLKSGSMEPALRTGSVVAVRRESQYKIKDVVTYSAEGTNITHRIITVFPEGKYFTKGDANDTRDPYLVGNENIVGKVIFYIPYLGYVTDFLRTKLGIFLTIIIPATLIIITETRNIIFELKKKKVKRSGSIKYAAVFIIFCFSLQGSGKIPLTTSAYFLSKSSMENSYQMQNYLLDFYFNSDKNAVGFKILGVSDVTQIKYSITYKRAGDITVGMDGTINNPLSENEITKQWLLLGSCSSLGDVCTYDNVISAIELNIILIKPDLTEISLSKSITP